MRRFLKALAVAFAAFTACSSPEKHTATPTAEATADGALITQFYSTRSRLPRGEKTLLCYGVENATMVWLEPPHQELSAALSRCVEMSPAADTTYILTASGPDGKSVTRELKVAVGAGLPKVLNVNVSAVQVKPGDLVSICYKVENSHAVTIDPLRYRGGKNGEGCATDQPRKTTTYTITATGSGGEKDQEKVTVQVK